MLVCVIKALCCEQECQRSKQQLLSLRRENGTLDAEVHEKERLVTQLQMRAAVLEQEVKDKEQLMQRTKEVLEATQQQKVTASELQSVRSALPLLPRLVVLIQAR